MDWHPMGGGRSSDAPCRFKRRKLGKAPVGRATWLQYRLNLFFLNDYNKYVSYPVKFQNNRILSLKFAIWGS